MGHFQLTLLIHIDNNMTKINQQTEQDKEMASRLEEANEQTNQNRKKKKKSQTTKPFSKEAGVENTTLNKENILYFVIHLNSATKTLKLNDHMLI